MPDEDKSIRQLFKGGTILLIGLVVQLGISFLGKLLVARGLSLTDFGGVALGMTLSSAVGTVALFGLQEGIGRFLPRYETEVNRRGVLVSGFTVAAPLGLGAAALMFLLAPTVATELFNSPDITPVLQVFSFVVPLLVVHRLVISTIQGNQRSVPKVFLENLLRPAARFLAIGAVIYVGISSVRIAGAYVFGWLVPVVAGLVYLYRETTLFEFDAPANTRRREMLDFSLPLLLSATLGLVLSDLDTLLLGYFSDTTAPVGVYNAVYPLGSLLTTGTVAFGFLFMPIISELHEADEMDRARRMYQVVTKWVFMFTLPLFLALVAFPERVIALTFGVKYAGGATALAVLSTGYFAHTMLGLNRETVVSVGETRIKMYGDFGAAVMNLALNLWLIPRFGLLGAATATAATFLVLNTFLSSYLYRYYDIVPFTAEILRPAALAGISFVAIYLLIRTFLSPTVPILVLGFTAFLLSYAVATLRFGGIEEEELLVLDSIEERFGVDFELAKRIARWFM